MIHYIILNYNFKLSIKNDTVNHLLNKAKPFVIYQTKFGCFYFLTTWMCNMELADNSWSVISVTYSHIHDLSFILQRHFFRLRLQLKCDVKNYTCLTSLCIIMLVRVLVFDCCVVLCDALHNAHLKVRV